MFDNRILEKILAKKELWDIPLEYRSRMIHAIEDILEEEEQKNDDK